MQTALILDAQLKGALCAARVLGCRDGVTVVTAATVPRALASWSRHSDVHVQYPSPTLGLARFIAWLEEYAQGCDTPPVVYAFSDATHLAIARSREHLQDKILFPWNETDATETAFDKSQTYALARTLHIPTIPEHDQDQVTQFPVVLKPHSSVSWATGQGKFGTAQFAFDADTYRQVRQGIVADTGQEPVVQTFVIGDEYGVELLCDDGRVLQQFTHRRVRSLSPRGGASVVKETAPRSETVEQMESAARRLLQELRWNGPAMVEFKYNEQTRRPVLMEINGRWWGSLPLPQRAGVDFVGEYWQYMTGDVPVRPAATPPAAPEHIRTQHFLGDCLHLYRVLFARDPLRARLYPGRLRAIAAFVYSTLFDHGDVWSWRDPVPSVGEVISVIQKDHD